MVRIVNEIKMRLVDKLTPQEPRIKNSLIFK